MVRKWYDDGADRLRYSFPLEQDSIVLDVGGFKGQYASDLFARHPCRIHVFEPVAKMYAGIEERFRQNDWISPHPIGLGGTTRQVYIVDRGDGSSLFKDARPGEVSGGNHADIVDVKEWLDGEGITDVALMKINIEGAEYELIERLCETGLQTRIGHILVQFHDFVSDADQRMQSLQSKLRKSHEPTFQYRFVWECWSRRK